MIDPALYQAQPAQQAPRPPDAACKKVFCMRSDDRMAGSVPVWEGRKGALEKVEQELSLAAAGTAGEGGSVPASALAYRAEGEIVYWAAPAQPESEFGFADLLDMINPLQHLPLVSNVYRYVTGDEIKPAARIVGGAAFGGFLGAASGLANTILEEETGKDLPGNVMAMVSGDSRAPRLALAEEEESAAPDNPELALNDAVLTEEDQMPEELPASLLGFTTFNTAVADKGHKLIPLTAGRSAGSVMSVDQRPAGDSHQLIDLPPRMPITQVSFSSLPLLEEDAY